jgi:hypothetical protein
MCWLLNSHFPSVKPAFLHPLGPPRPGGQRKKRSRAWQSEQRRIMAAGAASRDGAFGGGFFGI